MRTLLRRSFAALLVVGALALFVVPFAGAQTVCARTGSTVTIPAADTSITCNLKAGAVTYKVTVTPAPPKIVIPPKDTVRPAPIPVPAPTSIDTAKPTPTPVDTAKPTPPSGAYATPDVMNNASFESGWDGFTDWTMGGTPTNASRDASTAYDGTTSLKRAWTPNPKGDNTAQIATRVSSSGADHVWLRFYFKLSAPITSIMKFARFYQGTFNANLGGLFLGSGNDILTFGTDQENQAITTSIGVTQAQVIDGKWHSIEIDYWRNGDPSGYPSAAFWFDGQQLAGTAVKYFGAGNKSYWKDGRLYVGARASSAKINVMEWAATLNAGNTTTGQVNIDRVSISTTGRIGQ